MMSQVAVVATCTKVSISAPSKIRVGFIDFPIIRLLETAIERAAL